MGKGRGEGKKEIEMGIGEMQIRIDPYDGAMKIGVELGRTKEPRNFSYGVIKEIGKERKDIYEKEIKENEEEIIISDIEGNEERYKIETGDEEKEYPYQCKKEGKRLKKEEEKYEIKDSQGNRYQYGRNRRLLQYEGKNSEILQGYDEEGRIVYAIDQKGRSERYQYDAENRLIEQSGVMEGIGTKIKEENEIKNSDFREELAQYQTGGYAQVRVGKREHFLQQEEETWIQLASYGTSSYIEQRIEKKGKKKEEYYAY